MKEFIEGFINEAVELIDKVEKYLLEIEKSPDNTQIIQEIFRAMHSIKGAAGMYGYEKTGRLTHAIESVYDKIQHKEINFPPG